MKKGSHGRRGLDHIAGRVRGVVLRYCPVFREICHLVWKKT